MNEPTVEIQEDGAIILVNCPVADCYYAYRWRATAIGSPHEVENALMIFRDRHLPQHEPGRTRDVILETTVSGHCSNCGRNFSWPLMDGERIWCTRCGASWDEYGTDGRTDIEPPEDY